MTSPIFDKLISDKDSYNNFFLKEENNTEANVPEVRDYCATNNKPIQIKYKKIDPFVTVVPSSFFDSDDDLDKETLKKAIEFFQKK